MYNCFKLSPERQKRFEGFHDLVNIELHKTLKQCQTRWFSVLQCVERILEQWSASELFLYKWVHWNQVCPGGSDCLQIFQHKCYSWGFKLCSWRLKWPQCYLSIFHTLFLSCLFQFLDFSRREIFYYNMDDNLRLPACTNVYTANSIKVFLPKAWTVGYERAEDDGLLLIFTPKLGIMSTKHLGGHIGNLWRLIYLLKM